MNSKTYKISLLALTLACATTMPVDARISVKNSATYANAYNEVLATRQQAAAAAEAVPLATTASATANLPVAVDDEDLARSIASNTSTMVSVSDLQDCSMIYPNGVFKWAVPESGTMKNQDAQCVAVVELRDINTNAVLAYTTLASGDSMKCNIDMFPKSNWQEALETVTLPADNPPTIQDVEKVLNEEQKQNAGLKIAAAALLGGVAGNMLAPKEAGDTRIVGASKSQLVGTALAAAGSAGIMAASTYSGKVAGDTIKSTAVNAATGAVIGNMAAGMAGSGDSILNVKKCTIDGFEYDCVVGNLQTINADSAYRFTSGGKEVYFVNQASDLIKCTSPENQSGIQSCNDTNAAMCSHVNFDGINYHCESAPSGGLLKITLTNGKSFDEAKKDKKDTGFINAEAYERNDRGVFTPRGKAEGTISGDTTYFLVQSGSKPSGSSVHAYAVFDNLDGKLFGHKYSDWEQIKTDYSPRYFLRNSDGSVGTEKTQQKASEKENTNADEYVFTPVAQNASDGALVDFQNAARTKATLSGAAAGGAFGGYAAYQGAKQEVQERWLSEMREYNDSLDNFYCVTGTRPLSKYNDDAVVAAPKKSE